MTERSLAYLATVPIERVRGIGDRLGGKLRRAGMESVADLLLYTPRRYIDRSRVEPIASLRSGESATVVGTVQRISSRRIRGGRVMVEAVVGDASSTIKVTWFNQGFRERQLPPGTEVALFGKVDTFRNRRQLTNPVTEPIRDEGEGTTSTGRIVPIYPSIAGVASWRIKSWVENALRRSRPIADPVPPSLLAEHRLMGRDEAIALIHFPTEDRQWHIARRRLVYDELFRLELALALSKRHQQAESRGIAHEADGALAERFLTGLPFSLTDAQRRVLEEIRSDLRSEEAMHRLLQGEVGSGKTVVAVAALLWGVEGGYQGAVMAPTEVLAGQHFLGISSLLAEAGMAPPLEGEGARLGMESLFAVAAEDRSIRVALLTSSQVATNFATDPGRAEVLEWVAEGRVDLVVGTHALIQEGVAFRRLGVAVVDEQHRFGVAQRVTLREKGGESDPDLLIMTATPIPRTLSMTLYGDLDVSLLDELPPGRTPIRTVAVPKDEEEQAWELVRAEVAAGRQAYVVCPLVDDSTKVEAASATAEHERLQGVLEGLRVGLIHGQLHPRDKDRVMAAFRSGEIDVLVSTTVIEVGIDVANATVIVIEDAERFGLSQLHQLRGRVGRGEHPGTCVLLADPTTEDGEARITAMTRTTDGFELAEEDLRIRGQGTVFGERQSGVADLKLADILTDAELLVAARRDAFDLVEADPELSAHPELAAELEAFFDEEQRQWLFRS